ncbi:isoprenoid synthase domain-containing protein [Mycena vulgaris]|nr:isoprenoid synthase domain-containing protein [Mycena vulgaris]
MVKLGAHDYVQTLRGQTLRFPNLDLPMKDWPKGVSPHYEDLRNVQHIELKKIMGGEGLAYDVRVSTDCPYLAATWFPDARWDGLRLASQVATFLFLFDDDTDNPQLTDLVHNLDAAKKYREDGRKLFERYLADEPLLKGSTQSALSPTLMSIVPIGETVAFRMTGEQRAPVLAEVNKYIDACEAEQLSELSGSPPTIDEYLKCRMPASATGFLLACLEYIVDIDLGDTIRNDEYVREIFDATVCIGAIMNDLFSLKKELRYPFYNNAVAVLYHEHQDLQTAVDETYKIILRSIGKLEVAATRALERYPARREDLTKWIDGCKSMSTGNIAWSLHIARYGLQVPNLDGTTEIII